MLPFLTTSENVSHGQVSQLFFGPRIVLTGNAGISSVKSLLVATVVATVWPQGPLAKSVDRCLKKESLHFDQMLPFLTVIEYLTVKSVNYFLVQK